MSQISALVHVSAFPAAILCIFILCFRIVSRARTCVL